MSRRTSIVALVSALAVAAALGGLFFLSSRASAGASGRGYGPGMMYGGYGPEFGPGMMGRRSGYGSGTTGDHHSARVPRTSATLLIRHQHAHCHAWSLNGGRFEARQSLKLRRGAALTVINYDVMPHRLVELAGPPVTMHNRTTMRMMGDYVSSRPGLMNHMGASTKVTFSKPGIYRFHTRAGADYMPGIQTSGADNVLTLTVSVRH